MTDLLYQAALRFEKLTHTGYRIILGRKTKTFELQLRFPKNSFFHLAGLQYLGDITFSSQNKEHIYKEILQKKITITDLQKSVFFDTCFISERLQYLQLLENMLDVCQLIFFINPKEYIRHTKIYADYLCEYIIPNNTTDVLYYFLIKDRNSLTKNIYKGCSFFKKHDKDYRHGTAQTKLLLSEKIINVETPQEEIMELYRNPIYKTDFPINCNK